MLKKVGGKRNSILGALSICAQFFTKEIFLQRNDVHIRRVFLAFVDLKSGKNSVEIGMMVNVSFSLVSSSSFGLIVTV